MVSQTTDNNTHPLTSFAMLPTISLGTMAFVLDFDLCLIFSHNRGLGLELARASIFAPPNSVALAHWNKDVFVYQHTPAHQTYPGLWISVSAKPYRCYPVSYSLHWHWFPYQTSSHLQEKCVEFEVHVPWWWQGLGSQGLPANVSILNKTMSNTCNSVHVSNDSTKQSYQRKDVKNEWKERLTGVTCVTMPTKCTMTVEFSWIHSVFTESSILTRIRNTWTFFYKRQNRPTRLFRTPLAHAWYLWVSHQENPSFFCTLVWICLMQKIDTQICTLLQITRDSQHFLPVFHCSGSTGNHSGFSFLHLSTDMKM